VRGWCGCGEDGDGKARGRGGTHAGSAAESGWGAFGIAGMAGIAGLAGMVSSAACTRVPPTQRVVRRGVAPWDRG